MILLKEATADQFNLEKNVSVSYMYAYVMEQTISQYQKLKYHVSDRQAYPETLTSNYFYKIQKYLF